MLLNVPVNSYGHVGRNGSLQFCGTSSDTEMYDTASTALKHCHKALEKIFEINGHMHAYSPGAGADNHRG